MGFQHCILNVSGHRKCLHRDTVGCEVLQTKNLIMGQMNTIIQGNV